MSGLQNSIYSIPIKWQTATASTTMVAFNGYRYIGTSAGTFTLPSIINIGDVFAVQGFPPGVLGGFNIVVSNPATQLLIVGGSTGINLQANQLYSGVTLMCGNITGGGVSLIAANSSNGTFTVT